jgi:very-short-patch-repair endonuclease
VGPSDHQTAGEKGPPVLIELATRQHGVIARSQLAELGCGKGWIDGRLSTGYLHPLHRGVYAVGHRALGYRGRWMAAVLACGPGAVLSHRTAAAVLDLRSTVSGKIEVTAARTRKSVPGVTLHRPRSLHPDEVTTHDGFLVTTVERTLVDLAGTLTYPELQRAFEQALRLRILDTSKLRLTPGRKGMRNLRRVMVTYAPEVLHSREELERRFWAFVIARKFPRPALNVVVAGYEVDALWREYMLIVELDGYDTHGGLRAFESDHVKTANLQLAGYTVIRVTWRMLHDDPDRVAALLQAHFARHATAAARG